MTPRPGIVALTQAGGAWGLPAERRRPAALAAVVAVAVALCLPASAAARSLPFGFFGVSADSAYFVLPKAVQPSEQDVMVQSGVESLRIVINWGVSQPYQDFGHVPRRKRSQFINIGGIPTNLSEPDRLIAAAASRGLRVLPVVLDAPAWASANPIKEGAEPSDIGAYARFVSVLVRRYGPHGTFWAGHRAPAKVRIRQWQIWNEPDLPFQWTNRARDFAPRYVELLRESRVAIKALDPGGQVVLAGLTSSITWPRVWDAFQAIYDAGGRGLFDIAAVHPYTREPRNVLKILNRVHDVMSRNGDGGLPMAVTEFGWSSRLGHARHPISWEVTPAQQARNLTQIYNLFAANRRRLHLVSAYWYTWMSNDLTPYWSNWTGLRRRTGKHGTDKPALAAFRRVTRRGEGCRKRRLATRCG